MWDVLRTAYLWVVRVLSCLVTLGYSEYLRHRIWVLEQTGVEPPETRLRSDRRFRVYKWIGDNKRRAYDGNKGAQARQRFEQLQTNKNVWKVELYDGDIRRGYWEQGS